MTLWLAGFLVRRYRVLMFVAVCLALASWPLSHRLDLNWQVEGMFPGGDPLVASYRNLQTRFGGNDLCLAVYRDPELWDESGVGLERLEQVSQVLRATDGVQAVLSLAELHTILQKLREPLPGFSFSNSKTPALLNPDDRLAQTLARVFEGYTHRPDSQYVAVACLLRSTSQDRAEQRGPASHQHTLARLQQTMEQQLPAPATSGFVTGEPVLVAEGFRMVEQDGWRLGWVSSLLVSAVLLVCFRSLRWTLLPLCIVHWALWITRAMLVLLQLELTMISSTLTAIITVIGVATSMHLLLRFQQLRRQGHDRADALRQTLAVLLAPIFFACLTDAVGFSALMAAGVGPVRDFGLMMAIGSMNVFVALVVLVPGLTLIGSFDTDPKTPRLDLAVRLGLRQLLDRVLRYRWFGIVSLLLLLVWGGWGSSRIQVQTDFTKNFGEQHPLVQGLDIIESELGGAGVWDLMLPAPPELSGNYLEQVVALENRLRTIQIEHQGEVIQLTKVLSIADALKAVDADRLLSGLPVGVRLTMMRATMPEFTGALLTRAQDQNQLRWLRVMLRSREQVTAEAKDRLIAAVQDEVAAFTDRPAWTELFQSAPEPAEIAGYHVMLGKLVSNVLRDQWICFLLAIGGIYVVATLATGSGWFGFATLVTNTLPILLVLGSIGWSGAAANLGVAMIAAVSLGLSVDSSIHYLVHYRRRIADHATPRKALRSAHENVGLAALIATIALVAGFVSLCLSAFVPTVVFGSLAAVTMLGGLLGNLLVLPLLIAPAK